MIESRRDLGEHLAMDLLHHGLVRFTVFDYCARDVLRYQRRLRRLEYLHNRRKGPVGWGVYLVRRWLNKGLGVKLGFSIPFNCFGPGLCIVHYGTIVVNPSARIGKFCRIHPGTQIGEYHGAPTVGDYAYIGPGAKLFGPITVGDRVAIGANAVVNRSVPSDVTVAGVPAKVVSRRSTRELDLHPRKVFDAPS